MESEEHQHQQQPIDEEKEKEEKEEEEEEATGDHEEMHRHITDDEEEEAAAIEAQRSSSYFQDEREEDNDTHHPEAKEEEEETKTPISSHTEAVEENDEDKNQTAAIDRHSTAVVGGGDRLQQQQQQPLDPSSSSSSSSSSSVSSATERESFSARYLGSVRLPEGDLLGDKGLNSMTQCIASVTSKKSKKAIYELKENRKVNLALEGREMKVIGDDREAKILLCHPLNKIRAWAVGREKDSRHFAYVIRSADDAAVHSFVCRVFRCSAEARNVTAALRNICQRRADARSAAINRKL